MVGVKGFRTWVVDASFLPPLGRVLKFVEGCAVRGAVKGCGEASCGRSGAARECWRSVSGAWNRAFRLGVNDGADRLGARMEREARRGAFAEAGAEAPGDRFTSVYVYIYDAWPRSQEKILGGAERFFEEGGN